MSAEKLDILTRYNGKDLPHWLYREVPSDMRPATMRDLIFGRPVLYQLQLGSDAGAWLSDWVTPSTRPVLQHYIRTGIPVYVQESR